MRPFASPMMMGGDHTAPPFLLSGSWNTSPNLEGWTASRFSHSSSTPRTGPLCLSGLSGDAFVEYVLSAEQIKGLQITCSVWTAEQGTGSSPRQIGYRIGSGPEVVIASTNETSGAWQFLQGSFLASQDLKDAVTIRVSKSNNVVRLDDWTISGVKP